MLKIEQVAPGVFQYFRDGRIPRAANFEVFMVFSDCYDFKTYPSERSFCSDGRPIRMQDDDLDDVLASSDFCRRCNDNS